MYKLYWAPNTGAFAPDVVMSLAGTPFQRIAVAHDRGEQRSEAYLRINPMGQIPFLLLPDGRGISESAAMVLHLVDAYPAAGLAPAPGTPERAVFDRWLLFMAVNVYTADLRYYYPERYSTQDGGAEGVKAAAARDLDRQFDILAAALEASGGPFLLGADYGAADLYLLMLVDWYAPARRLPALQTLCDALLQLPEVKPVYDTYLKN
jgi:glutathione S-transferase